MILGGGVTLGERVVDEFFYEFFEFLGWNVLDEIVQT